MTARLLILISLLLATHPVGAQEEEGSAGQAEIAFQGYEGARPFEVVPRKDQLTFYPCAQCHQFIQPNPEIRTLQSPHVNELKHGEGRIWCLSCHHENDRDYLSTILGEKVDFDGADLVCGGCHANRHKDWHFGGHGKRVSNWQGERVIYSCAHCHDAHEPYIKPREPKPPPNVRMGLDRQEGQPHRAKRIWEDDIDQTEPRAPHE